jgi:hypothetical protein
VVALAAAVASLATACAEDARQIDPFPIRVDLRHGAVSLAVDTGDGPIPAILDTATPLTVLDPYDGSLPVPAARRRLSTVTLIGLDEAGEPNIPRARFPDTATLLLHPCEEDGLCRVGAADDPVEFRAIIGADILARSAARFDFPTSELRFFPDTSGDAGQLADECHAVIQQAFAGGGTLSVDGSEFDFGGWRPVIGACMDESGRPTEEDRGTDALFVLSTGMGATVLAASAYHRYAADTGATPLGDLPAGQIYFASGPADVRLGQIGALALVGSLSSSDEDVADRGPCRELHLNRVMARRQCEPGGPLEASCPCPDQAEFCSTGAAVDLDRTIDVAILDDGHPVLQTLRDELRPETPELDGILGTQALSSLRLELDYINNRMLMRCELTEQCRTLPAVRSQEAREALDRCREREELDGGVADAGLDAGLSDAAPDGGEIP